MTTTMPKCIVDYCRNYAGMRNNFANVMLHGFPTTVDRIKTWLRSIKQSSGHACENLDDMAVKIHQGKKHDSYRVCSEHFSKSCYVFSGEKRVLKKDAVPTVFAKEGEVVPHAVKQCSKKRSLVGKQAKKFVKRLSAEYSQQSSPEAKYIYKEKSKTDNDGEKITQIILNLTLEIIHLLTGEDYIVVKKSGNSVTPSSCPRVKGGLSRTQSPIMEPPPHSLMHERDNDQKILELTNKIVQLLTGEVPIRCEDVTVYFSLEEWEYIEGHRDLYKDMMIDGHKTLKSEGDPHNRYKAHSWVSCTNCANMNTSVDRDCQQSKCFQLVNQSKLLKKSVSNITKELDFYDERNLREQMDNITCIKGEPVSCEEEKFIDIDIDLKKYSSTHIKEEPVSRDREELTNTDMSTPTGHTQYTATHIKEEPVSYDGGDLIDTENDTSTDHTQDTSRHITAGSVSCDRGDVTDTDMYKPTGHTQSKSTHIKEEPVSCDGGDRTDIYTPTGHSQYISTHIKEEPASCDGGDLTHTDMYTPAGHTQYTSTHIKEESISCGDFAYTYMPLKCSECSECFACKSDLIYHQTLHRREKLRCSECGKYFSNKSNLSNHIRGHTGEKPYTCLTCGKCFTRKSTLVIHQRIHTGEKPFVCMECGRSFHGKGNLRKHQKVHRTTKPTTVKSVMQLPLALLIDSNIHPYQML